MGEHPPAGTPMQLNGQCPWPERRGLLAHVMRTDGCGHEYPVNGLGRDEVVVHVSLDPLEPSAGPTMLPNGLPWSCVVTVDCLDPITDDTVWPPGTTEVESTIPMAPEAVRQAGREAVADLFGGDFNAADDFLGKLYRAGFDVRPRVNQEHEGPWPFWLVRDEDVTGVSGTGVVAEGVEFTGKEGEGVVALRWLSDWPTSVVFHDRGIESVEHVHGHGGKTRLVWR